MALAQEQEALSRSVFIPAAGDCWLSRMLGARRHTESCSRPNLTLQQWVDPKPKQRNEAGLWWTSDHATGTESWFLGCFLKLCCWRPKKQSWIWLALSFISVEKEFWCWATTSVVERCPSSFYCFWMSRVFTISKPEYVSVRMVESAYAWLVEYWLIPLPITAMHPSY